MRFKAVSKASVSNKYGGGEKTSKIRTEVGKLANEMRDFFIENADTDLLAIEDENASDGFRGIVWLDLEDDLQDACKREKGGGMLAIVGNINRNYKESHGLRATLKNAGESKESGEILVYRHTPKDKS